MKTLKEYLNKKKKLKQNMRANHIKQFVVDASVFDGLDAAEIIDLWDKFHDIMREFDKNSLQYSIFKWWRNSPKIASQRNEIQEKYAEILKENPRLMQMSVTDRFCSNLCELFCNIHLDDLVYYIASNEYGQKLKDCYDNNIAMIAVHADRPELAIEFLRNGFVDPLYQNVFKENLGHIACKEAAVSRDDLLEYCTVYPQMWFQKDEYNRTVLRVQAECLSNRASDKYFKIFKFMLGNKKLRWASNESLIMPNDSIWSVIDSNLSISSQRMAELSKMKKDDMQMEK